MAEVRKMAYGHNLEQLLLRWGSELDELEGEPRFLGSLEVCWMWMISGRYSAPIDGRFVTMA